MCSVYHLCEWECWPAAVRDSVLYSLLLSQLPAFASWAGSKVPSKQIRCPFPWVSSQPRHPRRGRGSKHSGGSANAKQQGARGVEGTRKWSGIVVLYESTSGEALEKDIFDVISCAWSNVITFLEEYRRLMMMQKAEKWEQEDDEWCLSDLNTSAMWDTSAENSGFAPFKYSLFITLQLPWYSHNAKTTQGINNSWQALMYRESERDCGLRGEHHVPVALLWLYSSCLRDSDTDEDAKLLGRFFNMANVK